MIMYLVFLVSRYKTLLYNFVERFDKKSFTLIKYSIFLKRSDIIGLKMKMKKQSVMTVMRMIQGKMIMIIYYYTKFYINQVCL